MDIIENTEVHHFIPKTSEKKKKKLRDKLKAFRVQKEKEESQKRQTTRKAQN